MIKLAQRAKKRVKLGMPRINKAPEARTLSHNLEVANHEAAKKVAKPIKRSRRTSNEMDGRTASFMSRKVLEFRKYMNSDARTKTPGDTIVKTIAVKPTDIKHKQKSPVKPKSTPEPKQDADNPPKPKPLYNVLVFREKMELIDVKIEKELHANKGDQSPRSPKRPSHWAQYRSSKKQYKHQHRKVHEGEPRKVGLRRQPRTTEQDQKKKAIAALASRLTAEEPLSAPPVAQSQPRKRRWVQHDTDT